LKRNKASGDWNHRYKNKMKQEYNNQTFSVACQEGFNSFLPVPKLGRRIVLTQDELDEHIGKLKDIHSKKGKTISELKSTYGYYKPLIDEFCRHSNGGLADFTINQKNLRGTIVNCKPLQAQTLSNIIQNLIHHGILSKVDKAQNGVIATTYRFSNKFRDILDPVKITLEFKNKAREKTKQELRDYGFNPDNRIICPVCAETKWATAFGIYVDPDNKAIVYQKPCCKECEWKYSKADNKPQVFTTVWRLFRNRVSNQKFIMVEEPEDLVSEVLGMYSEENTLEGYLKRNNL
jgi:hypothetical protein